MTSAAKREWRQICHRIPDVALHFFARGIETRDPALVSGVYYTRDGGCFAYWVNYFNGENGRDFGTNLYEHQCPNLIQVWDTRREELLPLIRAEIECRRRAASQQQKPKQHKRQESYPVHPEKEKKLLRALAVQVPGISHPQLRQGLHIKPKAIRPLIEAKLVSPLSVLASPPPRDIGEPFTIWEGGAEPPMEQIIYQNNLRQKELVPVPTNIVCATLACGRLFGVARTGTLPQPLQGSHALSVAALFVHYAEHSPETIDGWYGENSIQLHGSFAMEKTPDVFLFQDQRLTRVIEVLGIGYTAEKLHALHRECDRLGISYALH